MGWNSPPNQCPLLSLEWSLSVKLSRGTPTKGDPRRDQRAGHPEFLGAGAPLCCLGGKKPSGLGNTRSPLQSRSSIQGLGRLF